MNTLWVRYLWRIVLVPLILVLNACATAEQAGSRKAFDLQAAQHGEVTESGIVVQETLDSEGVIYGYRLFVPKTYRGDQAAPLVIALHGFDMGVRRFEELTGLSELAAKEGFIAAYPQAQGSDPAWRYTPGGGWQDIKFVRNLILHLQEKWNIDSRRVYLVGFSNGAQMANAAACEHADLVAAIGLVSGAHSLDEPCQPSRPVAVVAFHGTADNVLLYDGQGKLLPVRDWMAGWAAKNGCTSGPELISQQEILTIERWDHCGEGAQVSLHTVQGGEHEWPGNSELPSMAPSAAVNATSMIWSFFKTHPRR